METIPIAGEKRELALEALGRSAWFKALQDAAVSLEDAEQAQQIVLLGEMRSYADAETIIKVDDASNDFFLLIQGAGEVRLGSGEGTSVGQLEPPTTFGEIGLLLDEPRTATITAVGEVIVLRFSAAAFHTMMDTIPKFGLQTSRYLARRVMELSEQVVAV